MKDDLYDQYKRRVEKIADIKYDLSEDILEGFEEDMEIGFNSNTSPRQIASLIASKIFIRK